MNEAIKIIFFGTPEFAVDSLDTLVSNGFDITAVVTAPDQPAGRGQVMQSSPVKNYAANHGIQVLQPEKLKNQDFLHELRELKADLFIVVAFRMLPEAVWQMPPLGTYNLHASLLPQYRGAAPINHVIINGETETGLTTFFIRQEIDTGEIIFQEKISILPDETAGELHDRMKKAGASLVLKTARAICTGRFQTIAQGKLVDPAVPLKSAPKIFKEDCMIDWSMKTSLIYNKIRGLSPYPAAFTHLISPDGVSIPVKIYKVSPSKTGNHDVALSVYTDGKAMLSVRTGDGMLDILELQQAGKRKMAVEEFLRGFRINSDWKVG